MLSTATSPITDTKIAIWYSLLDKMVDDGTGNPKQVTYGHVDYALAPRQGSMALTTTVQDGHQYSWNTQASDTILSSNTVANCRFNVDTTLPAPPPSTAPTSRRRAAASRR
ncbi:hypothetical protein ACFQZC_08675 [Streptacidiphilus monticola]